MELTEVVTPSVAVPVLCVLLCAFLVFAFGFKSPAQPPSFDVLDDDSRRKKVKKSKGSKGQSNGHAVITGETDANNSAKPQSSPRQSTKQSGKASATITKSKTATQSSVEAPKKNKKQTAREEEVKQGKKQDVQEDVDMTGWHTVPKKDKKQKKKESEAKPERQDSPVKEEELEPKTEETAATGVDSGVDITGSPQEQRSKKKEKRKNKVVKSEEEITPAQAVPVTSVDVTPGTVLEPQPKVDNSSIELQIQEAMETVDNGDNSVTEKKRNNKKDKKKALPTPEEDDFVIPHAALEPEVGEKEPDTNEALPLKENTEALTVKVAKKKQKKDRSKRNEEKPTENIELSAGSGADSSLSQPSVSDVQPKKTKPKEASIPEPAVAESSPEPVESEPSIASNPSQSAVFDELGGTSESWTEAKPKSKKKKARRAD